MMPNWEAMQVALERLRIMTISGRRVEAFDEFEYLLTNLIKLRNEIYDPRDDVIEVASVDQQCHQDIAKTRSSDLQAVQGAIHPVVPTAGLLLSEMPVGCQERQEAGS